MLVEAGCPFSVIRHCCMVMAAATLLAERCDADVELVKAGALLHDIGRARTHGIEHVAKSVEIARSLGLPRALIKIIATHVGAGLTSEEAVALGLPPGNYLPNTLEEKLVCHADNLIDNDTVITLEDALNYFRSRGLKTAAEKMEVMSAELTALLGERPDAILARESLQERITGPCSAYVNQQ